MVGATYHLQRKEVNLEAGPQKRLKGQNNQWQGKGKHSKAQKKEGRKERRKEGWRKEGGKERKEGRKEGKKEGRHEGKEENKKVTKAYAVPVRSSTMLIPLASAIWWTLPKPESCTRCWRPDVDWGFRANRPSSVPSSTICTHTHETQHQRHIVPTNQLIYLSSRYVITATLCQPTNQSAHPYCHQCNAVLTNNSIFPSTPTQPTNLSIHPLQPNQQINLSIRSKPTNQSIHLNPANK